MLNDNLIPCNISSFRNLVITSMFVNWLKSLYFLLNFKIYIYFKHKHNTDLSMYFIFQSTTFLFSVCFFFSHQMHAFKIGARPKNPSYLC